MTMTQFICKGVKQINNRISFKYDIHLYHSYLSTFFVSAGVPNGEFPEILIAKFRSRFYCTWFFSRAEVFESWQEERKGPSKSGEQFFVGGRSCRRLMSPVQETQSMWEIRLLCRRLPRKGGGLTGMQGQANKNRT
jgi:hypothetical protein